ncbi:nucleotidyltransferase [Falsibacillus albus]|nr:nucleotidyltransferase [Falsibacillus albus]
MGVIVEYNPFHNGHLHHLEISKMKTNADAAIAVMSGNFLQRGEPALVSKWSRAKMALRSGVDIVIELPYAFATQKAETFAFGSICLLDAMHCQSYCFGSESGDIGAFTHTIEKLERSEDRMNSLIKENIKEGMSYPSSVSKAIASLGLTGEGHVDLTTPNNILGYHYMKAAREIGTAMKAFTIQRKNADYHDEDFSSATIASATSIRKALFSEGFQQDVIRQYVPESTIEELISYHKEFTIFHQWERYWPLLQYRLISASLDELANIYEIEEGIEHRLKEAAQLASSFQEFMTKVKTKRYTWTRIQRMVLHVLTNTTKEQMISHCHKPSYIRLLGMNEKGRKYLGMVKKELSLPMISKLSSAKQEDIHLDIRASNVYAQGLPEPYKAKLMKMEYSQPPIQL